MTSIQPDYSFIALYHYEHNAVKYWSKMLELTLQGMIAEANNIASRCHSLQWSIRSYSDTFQLEHSVYAWTTSYLNVNNISTLYDVMT
jgi:hypothetical protein